MSTMVATGVRKDFCHKYYKNLWAWGEGLVCFMDWKCTDISYSICDRSAMPYPNDDGAGVYLRNTNILMGVLDMSEDMVSDEVPVAALKTESVSAFVLNHIVNQKLDEYDDYPEWKFGGVF